MVQIGGPFLWSNFRGKGRRGQGVLLHARVKSVHDLNNINLISLADVTAQPSALGQLLTVKNEYVTDSAQERQDTRKISNFHGAHSLAKIDAGSTAIIAPMVLHYVVLSGPARFKIEFLK